MSVKIALDPTPYHSTHGVLDYAEVAARAGYAWLQLTPHVDFLPFFRHPRADDELVAKVKKAASDAGVGISSLLPVQRISAPDEEPRRAAVANFRRILQIAVDLEVPVINTEFSGRPERSEESEAAFYRSMAELIPDIEAKGLSVNFDPHPDDFVENGLEAVRIIRGLNCAAIGFVYVGAHTFHYGDDADAIMSAAGDRLRAAYVADSFDHHRSHGLRYITNPPGNTVRVHQHLAMGDGDVDWNDFYTALQRNGFYGRDGIVVSNVFAEDERADDVSRQQLDRITSAITQAGGTV